MESQRLTPLGVATIIALLVLPLPGKGEVSCHPNIFGGQDCTSPEGALHLDAQHLRRLRHDLP